MRYLGAALIIFAAALIASGYRERLAGRVRAAEDVLALVRHIRERMACNLEPPRVWAAEFKTENAQLTTMMKNIRSGASALDAYACVKEELEISDDADICLRELFSLLGGIDIDAQIRALARAEEKLVKLIDKGRSDALERGRVAVLVALMLSVGGAIVII